MGVPTRNAAELAAAREGRYEDLPALLGSYSVAEILSVSPSTVNEWANSGLIKFVRIGRIKKYHRDAVLEMAGFEPCAKEA